jgi:hypothetical protein
MKIRLTLSVMVPATGEYEIEAESVEAAIEQLQHAADSEGWSMEAWQNTEMKTDWSGAEKFCIEPYELPDGSQTDYCELLNH